MPTPYFAGQTTTIRSLPESTKHLIQVLTTALRCTQAEAVSAAVEAYFDALAENGKVDDVFVKLVRRARTAGRLERRRPRPPLLVESGEMISANLSVDVHCWNYGGSDASTSDGQGRVTPDRPPQEKTVERPIRTDQTGDQAAPG